MAVTVEFHSIHGTEAALGSSGGHTLVVDRPAGKAGGRGLGFNGAELTALALGGCFSNDLRYVAHAAGVALGAISVRVTVELTGEPLMITSAALIASCETLDGSDPQELIERARAVCTVGNSMAKGIPVSIAGAVDPGFGRMQRVDSGRETK